MYGRNLMKISAITAAIACGLCAQEFTVNGMLATGIPVMSINTENSADITSKEYYTKIESFELIDPNNSSNNISRLRADVARPDRPADEIRGRGNATWGGVWDLNYPKKPYRIRFTGQIEVLGLPKARNWVVLAEFRDPSDMFNAYAFHIAKNVFEMPFTHNYIHVHLFLNGNYRGVYGLTEHKQVHENRINIDQNEGWYVNIDNYYDEHPRFRTNQYNLPVMIKSPEPEGEQNMNNSAYNFVRDDWNRLTDLMNNWDFPENGYRDLIDINSVIDYLLVNEITKNEELGGMDVITWEPNIRSLLVYKDKGKKITFGPVWDFDCGFGYDYQSTHIYFTNHNGFIAKHPFIQRFYDDPVFTARLRERWHEKYDAIRGSVGFADNIRQKIASAIAEDNRRWYFNNNYESSIGYVSSEYNTDHSQVVSNMKTWLNNRIEWLNGEINGRYTGKINMASVAVTLSETQYSYDGAQKTPKATVDAFGKILTEGVHYNVTYSNNTEIGNATATITGIGDYYTGSKDVNFTINNPTSAQAPIGAGRIVAPLVMLRGRTLNVSLPQGTSVRIRLVDTMGKVRADFNTAAENERFSLSRLPAGRYFAEVSGAGVRNTVPIVLK